LLFRHFLEQYGEIREDAFRSVETFAGCGGELSLAGQFARAVEFREEVRTLETMKAACVNSWRCPPRGNELPREEPRLLANKVCKALVRGLKDEAEMEGIADALEKTRWCRKDAAKMLGISYKLSLQDETV
jgi:hypothetical protein